MSPGRDLLTAQPGKCGNGMHWRFRGVWGLGYGVCQRRDLSRLARRDEDVRKECTGALGFVEFILVQKPACNRMLLRGVRRRLCRRRIIWAGSARNKIIRYG